MKIAIIGACGYIGSMLYDDLKMEHEVECFDKTDTLAYPLHRQIKANEIDVRGFDIVLYFAGLSRKGDCDRMEYKEVYDRGVTELVKLVEKLDDTQVCIYSSTGSVYYNQRSVSECDQIDETCLQNYEIAMLAREKSVTALGKRTIALRMGTVIGQSPNIRLDLLYHGLYYSAFSFNEVSIRNPNSWRCILWYTDLVNALGCLIKSRDVLTKPDVFNIGSFNASIGDIGDTVAKKTGSKVTITTTSTDTGFQMNCDKFTQHFGYTFIGTKDTIDTEYTVNKDLFMRRATAPTGYHTKCLICRNAVMDSVLDLGSQPLANNFMKKLETVEKYPLHVYRCKYCTHTQLNYLVDRSELFRNYIYESGTSATMRKYFKELAETYTRKIATPNRTVLEIACNDGYQLDEFKALGWKTYGIDPAANLLQRARANGHCVESKFWGVEATTIVDNVHLDLIIAENVFAHVINPVGFLQKCADVMDSDTLLVIQTSQANMYPNNEFDTIYHEHVSFFTVQSMLIAAKNAGCTLVNVYKTAVHGVSYVFEIKKGIFEVPELVCLTEEITNGMYTDAFYKTYRNTIEGLKEKSIATLKEYASNGYSIIGFGAAAKGNVFLNYVFDSRPSPYAPECILDDSILKQGKFTAGTEIEVVGYDRLQSYIGKKLLIVILAWNFSAEIIQRIEKTIPAGIEYKCLQFFPA
jgi:nucleoside-diphosphate-sugar epimerase/2-polyprenyl-3-methyl-5-hydroxy-6-metoxy-1,4-benzoquinol methylase